MIEVTKSCAIRRKRTTFKPDELATTFVSLQREKRVDGLFLSSGIVPDANTTMEKMLATVVGDDARPF